MVSSGKGLPPGNPGGNGTAACFAAAIADAGNGGGPIVDTRGSALRDPVTKTRIGNVKLRN
jgi:hypothetical protein